MRRAASMLCHSMETLVLELTEAVIVNYIGNSRRLKNSKIHSSLCAEKKHFVRIKKTFP